MSSGLIENDLLRYAVSFLAILACVVAAVAVTLVLPSSVPNHDLVSKVLILLGGLVGLYLMLRIEKGPAPFRRQLESLLQ